MRHFIQATLTKRIIMLSNGVPSVLSGNNIKGLARTDRVLSTLATNTTCELNVLWHDSYAFRVNCTKICVFEEANKIRFGGFLQGQNCCRLEPKIGFEILCYLADESLERSLPNEKLSGFLIFPNFSESNCSGTVPMGFFDTASGWRGFSCSLSCELLAGRFASG
mmetsp:Transcript_20937/g.41891  ORF Transcript_20937/g.41891 Transcript_20937/m.41891 type:complete len:165 (-) Transcript_20937:188-682(-)